MTLSKIFKTAHALAQKTLAKKSKAGKNYSVTFSACLKEVYAKVTVEISYLSKALRSGGNRWVKNNMDRVYFNFESLSLLLDGEVGEFKNKTKVYLDVKTDVFYSDNGMTVRNALRAAGYPVKKI